MITSDKQIIDNLSRIRVLPKINFNNNNNEVLSIDSKSESLKSMTSSNISFDLSPKPVNDSNAIKTNFCEINNFNTDNKEVICVEPKPNHNYNYDNYCIKRVGNTLSNETTVNSFKPQLVANSISSNSEELSVNFFSRNLITIESNKLSYKRTVIKVDNISYIALTLSSEEINAFKLLLQIIISNINLLRSKSSNTLEPNSCWVVVSNQMIGMGHKEWEPSKCRAIYYTSITLYKKV